MLEAIGDLWTYPTDAICITTNGVVKANGELVMGAGVAKQAANRYPDLPARIGKYVTRNGNVIGLFEVWSLDTERPIISFPTKHHWKDKSDPNLIEANARRLASIIDAWGYKRIALTRPGCGLGDLTWAEVKPVIAPILDDRFTVLTPKPPCPKCGTAKTYDLFKGEYCPKCNDWC